MIVKIKRLNENSVIPTHGSEDAAGYDLYANIPSKHGYGEIEIQPGETAMIHTGIALDMPEGYFGAVFARSGLATKQGLRLATGTSVVDEDYKGEIMVPLHNDSQTAKTVEDEDRIAQIVFLPYQKVGFLPVDELEETKRGENGFGSTGTGR